MTQRNSSISIGFRSTVAGLLAAVVLLMSGPWSGAVAQTVAAATSQPAEGRFSVEDVERLWPRLTPRQQFVAVEQLIKGGRFDVAERLLARTNYPHTGDNAIKRFYQGMIARGLGRNAEAVATFREVLAQNPEFTRVRLELANTLFEMKEDDSARHNFELILGGASATPGLQDAVRSYINAIDGRRRWDLTTFLTIAPSTNLNQGSSAQVVDINGVPFALSSKNVKKSGVGVYAGVQAGYRQPLTDNLDLVISGGGQAKRYRDDEFNDTLVNAAVGPRWRFDRGYLGLYGITDYRWVGDSDYNFSFGGLLSGAYSITAADIVYADLLCSKRRFDKSWYATDISYQDGTGCSLGGRLDHHIDSRTYLRFLGQVGRDDAGRDHLDNMSYGGGAGVYREMPLGISVYLQGMFTYLDYKGIYPGFAEARADKRYDVSVNLTKRDLVIMGLAPQVQYTFTHVDSSVPFHTYDAHGLAFTLTKRF